MINYTPQSIFDNQLFLHPFEKELNPENRWIKLRSLLPWDEMAKILMQSMSDEGRGSFDLRYVFGVLVIQSLENLPDESLIPTIEENVYMQYFIGLPAFTTKPIFVPELLVTFRKRLGKQGARELSEIIVRHASTHHDKQQKHLKKSKDTSDKSSDQSSDNQKDSGAAPLHTRERLN